MDTMFGMGIHDIPGNVINHCIFLLKIDKVQKIDREVIMQPILPLLFFVFLNLYIQEHGPSIQLTFWEGFKNVYG